MVLQMQGNFLWRFCGIGILLILAAYLPLYLGFTLFQLFTGIVGELSIVSLILLCTWLFKILFLKNVSIMIQRPYAVLVVITGLLLYASTCGFIAIDIYRIGYFPTCPFLICIGVAAIYFWYHARAYSWYILLALICFYFKVQESNNLWDYLFDPGLWIMSIISLFKSYFAK